MQISRNQNRIILESKLYVFLEAIYDFPCDYFSRKD